MTDDLPSFSSHAPWMCTDNLGKLLKIIIILEFLFPCNEHGSVFELADILKLTGSWYYKKEKHIKDIKSICHWSNGMILLSQYSQSQYKFLQLV
jgi:hypothetical protein